MHLNESIRYSLKHYQDQLIEKDDEILRLKEDFKYSRFQGVEFKYNQKTEEFDQLKVQFDLLRVRSIE